MFVPLCECGCGFKVNYGKQNKCWNRFINGHNWRGQHTKMTKEQIKKSSEAHLLFYKLHPEAAKIHSEKLKMKNK